MNKINFPLALILIFLTAVNSYSNTLLKIDHSEDQQKYNIFLTFNSAPPYTDNQTDRKIDLKLSETLIDKNLIIPTADGKVAKYRLNKQGKDLYLTLYLRYKPESYKIERIGKNKLCLSFTIGSVYSNSFKELSRQLKGLRKVDGNKGTLSPLETSPYRFDWKYFFSSYQPDIKINIPISYTWPAFPIIQYLPPKFEENINAIPEDLLINAKQNIWSDLTVGLPQLIKDDTNNTEVKKLLALTYGEALAHSGDFEGSYKQLYLLKEKYPKTAIANLAHYLLLVLQNIHIDPYLANVEFEQVASKIGAKNPLRTYLKISQIETALAAGDLPKMNELLLDDELAMPKDLQTRLDLRQADYWYSLKQPIKAAAAYRLAHNTEIIQSQPFSINGYCESLFLQNKFKEAKDCYYELRNADITAKDLSLVNYKLAIVKNALTKELGKKIVNYGLVADTYATLEGGVRSLIKSYDQQILGTNDTVDYEEIAEKYLEITKKNWPRDIVEEAMLKAAAAFHLADDSTNSVKILKQYQDRFKVGNLEEVADALLVQTIPTEIKKLFENKKYKETILLLQANRDMLINQWFGDETSIKLGLSYYQLGLYKEANKIFKYLLTILPNSPEVYLPLIKSSYALGEYNLVDDYATRFKHISDNPDEVKEASYYQNKALYNMGKASLHMEDAKDGKELTLAAEIAYTNKDYEDVINLLITKEKPIPMERFWLAESYFQTKKYDSALDIFAGIDNKEHEPQSLYRQAEILLNNNNNIKAEELLNKLINDYPSNSWAKLARIDISAIELKPKKDK